MSDEEDLRNDAKTEDWLNGTGDFRGKGPAFFDEEPEDPKPIKLGPTETCYWIICPVHGSVNLTRRNYEVQMSIPDAKWVCVECGSVAEWDDAKYEATEGEYYQRLENAARESHPLDSLEDLGNDDPSVFGPDQ